MGMTRTKKILAAHAGQDHMVVGQLIEVKILNQKRIRNRFVNFPNVNV